MNQVESRYATLPAELIQRTQWVVWRYDTNPKGERSKVPYNARTGHRAKVNDPTTFVAFETAVDALDCGEWEGIGFVITADDDLCGIDLDDCLDDHGDLRDWAAPIAVGAADIGYGEISPSGSGIKFLTRADKPDGSGNKKSLGDGKQGLEIYDGTNRKTGKPGHRWWAMTGECYAGADTIGDGTKFVADLCEKHLMPQKRSHQTSPNERGRTGATAESSKNGRRQAGTEDVIDRAIKYISAMPAAISGEHGHDKLYSVAAVLVVGFDLSPSIAQRIILDHYNSRCDPEWSDDEIQRKVDAADEITETRGELNRDEFDQHDDWLEKMTSGGASCAGGESSRDSDPWLLDIQHRTENYFAQRFIDEHSSQVRFVAQWGKWLVWDGKRWEIDHNSVAVSRLVRLFCRGLWDQAGELGRAGVDPKEIGKVIALISGKNTSRSVDAIVKLARSDSRVSIDHRDLNRKPYLLNLQNGTFDLESFELRAHDPADLITQVANVSYGETAECPLWDDTLQFALAGDAEMIDYVHRLFGYSLTGDQGEHILPIFWGGGCNGKSTVWNTLHRLLGDYAGLASDTLLLGDKDDHATEKADLFGRRLVFIPEPGEGARLKESRMKELTGDGIVTARRMREDFWQFDRTFTLFIATNHLPKVSGTDEAVWRRIRKILFGQDFRKKDGGVITDIVDQMVRGEGPGILNHLIDGWRRYVDAGRKFEEPISVINETEEYRQSEDPIGEFFAECVTMPWEGSRPLARRVHGAYRKWCEVNGIPKSEMLGATRFKSAMESHGVVYGRISSGVDKGRVACFDIRVKGAQEIEADADE